MRRQESEVFVAKLAPKIKRRRLQLQLFFYRGPSDCQRVPDSGNCVSRSIRVFRRSTRKGTRRAFANLRAARVFTDVSQFCLDFSTGSHALRPFGMCNYDTPNLRESDHIRILSKTKLFFSVNQTQLVHRKQFSMGMSQP